MDRESSRTSTESGAVIVFVHGIFSSEKTWGPFLRLISSDPSLERFDTRLFNYATPKVRLSPLRSIPNYNIVADNLQSFLEIDLKDYSDVVIVSHSQGGLIVQRYLARMIASGAATKLSRIKKIVLFACPNAGSQFFLSVRRGVFFWKHPQERALRPIDESVADANRRVMEHIVNASAVSATTCPILIVAFAGDQDGIVPPPSARGAFPAAKVIPGDHSTIVRPTSQEHRSYTTLRAELQEVVAARTAGAPEVLQKLLESTEPRTEPPNNESYEARSDVQVTARLGPLEFDMSYEHASSLIRELLEQKTTDDG